MDPYGRPLRPVSHAQSQAYTYNQIPKDPRQQYSTQYAQTGFGEHTFHNAPRSTFEQSRNSRQSSSSGSGIGRSRGRYSSKRRSRSQNSSGVFRTTNLPSTTPGSPPDMPAFYATLPTVENFEFPEARPTSVPPLQPWDDAVGSLASSSEVMKETTKELFYDLAAFTMWYAGTISTSNTMVKLLDPGAVMTLVYNWCGTVLNAIVMFIFWQVLNDSIEACARRLLFYFFLRQGVLIEWKPRESVAKRHLYSLLAFCVLGAFIFIGVIASAVTQDATAGSEGKVIVATLLACISAVTGVLGAYQVFEGRSDTASGIVSIATLMTETNDGDNEGPNGRRKRAEVAKFFGTVVPVKESQLKGFMIVNTCYYKKLRSKIKGSKSSKRRAREKLPKLQMDEHRLHQLLTWVPASEREGMRRMRELKKQYQFNDTGCLAWIMKVMGRGAFFGRHSARKYCSYFLWLVEFPKGEHFKAFGDQLKTLKKRFTCFTVIAIIIGVFLSQLEAFLDSDDEPSCDTMQIMSPSSSSS